MADAQPADLDLALDPAPLRIYPRAGYASGTRKWQGIPGVERAANGRLWALWYTGGTGEGPDNYVVVVTSHDDGQTWSEPALVIDPSGRVRAYDPCPWVDPRGRLWIFWAQSYEWFDGRCGVFATVADDPGHAAPAWSPPRRLADGIMMCKPTVLADGRWLMPAAVWDRSDHRRIDMDALRYSNVYESTDEGITWNRLGAADVPRRVFDEHMTIERRDGSLWMLVRTSYGIGQSFSFDGGRTWTPGEPSRIPGPGSRFFIRRLQSGALLLVNHHQFKGRSHMTAMLSDDDGQSWAHHLLLDERPNVSYPDGTQASDGRIYVAYDRERQRVGQILLAVFTEADIRAGRPISGACRLALTIDQLHH